MIRAALFDFGGVILASPFDAFTLYEEDNRLPRGFIRRLNATNPDANAWARLERGEVAFEEFCGLFEAEAAAAGGCLEARAVMQLLQGEVRPEMVEAVRRCHERLKTALLTNNWVGPSAGFEPAEAGPAPRIAAVLELFDVIVESSRVGIRKPDPRFYRTACDLLGIEPAEAVFLDDLGINLKPAKAMGMTTIKVLSADQALGELETVLGFALR